MKLSVWQLNIRKTSTALFPNEYGHNLATRGRGDKRKWTDSISIKGEIVRRAHNLKAQSFHNKRDKSVADRVTSRKISSSFYRGRLRETIH